MDNITLITGFTSGTGKATAQAMLTQPGHLLLVCRNRQLGSEVIHAFQKLRPKATLHLYTANLASMHEVKHLAITIRNQWPHLNLLINNAGTFSPTFQVNAEGLETTIATNYFAPFLLTLELMPLLQQAATAGVINVASEAAHKGMMPLNGKYNAMQAYCNSKLYLLMFTVALAQKLKSSPIKVNAMHPGGVNSNFGKNVTGITGLIFRWLGFMMRTPEQGADTIVWLTNPDHSDTGNYYINRTPVAMPALCSDEKSLTALWEYTLNVLSIEDKYV